MYLNHNDWTEVCLLFHKNYERMKQKSDWQGVISELSFYLLDGVMLTSSYFFFIRRGC